MFLQSGLFLMTPGSRGRGQAAARANGKKTEAPFSTSSTASWLEPSRAWESGEALQKLARDRQGFIYSLFVHQLRVLGRGQGLISMPLTLNLF